MRRLILLCLPLAACAPEPGPEQLAARRAEAMLHAAGHANTTLLAPLAGLDGEGQPGVCGLIETRAGPVRVVVALATGSVRTGVPALRASLARASARAHAPASPPARCVAKIVSVARGSGCWLASHAPSPGPPGTAR